MPFNPAAENLPADELWGFVEIPAGVFMMGSDGTIDPEAENDEGPRHPVTLPAYFIGKYEVTVGQYKACVSDGGCAPVYKQALSGPDDLPVRFVSWREALAYCDWLDKKIRASSSMFGRLGDPSLRITLPTEAEWERAARGALGRRYPWGNTIDPTRANYDATGKRNAVVVGSFAAGRTPEGVYDLAGNVEEWTRSIYVPYPYTAADGRERPDGDHMRVIRGGSFRHNEFYMRVTYRGKADPNTRFEDVGFRLVSSRLRP